MPGKDVGRGAAASHCGVGQQALKHLSHLLLGVLMEGVCVFCIGGFKHLPI